MIEKNIEQQGEEKFPPDSIKEFMRKYPHYAYPIPEIITPGIENLAIKNELAVKKMREEVLPRLKTKVVGTGAGYKLAFDYQAGEKPTLEDLASDIKLLGVSQQEQDRVLTWHERDPISKRLSEEKFDYFYLSDVLLRKLDDLHHEVGEPKESSRVEGDASKQ